MEVLLLVIGAVTYLINPNLLSILIIIVSWLLVLANEEKDGE